MDKIDFVLPWVDINDKNWRSKRSSFIDGYSQNMDAVSDARYRDMGTLKFVLRSIEKNCPWFNKIYLITDSQIPDWLDMNSQRVVVVDHNQMFLDLNDLPVFNSVAIEMNLHNIKDLSDKFVYLNDDMIIWNKLEKSRFFVNDFPVDYFTHGWIPRNKLFQALRDIETVGHSLNNVFTLFNENLAPYNIKNDSLYHCSYSRKDKIINFLFSNIFRKIYWMENWHHPQPYLRSSIIDFSNKFGDEMRKVSKNRFRDKTDLSQYMYRYWNLINGKFYPHKYRDGLTTNINSINSFDNLVHNINSSTNFVCFNDSIHLSDLEYELVSKKLVTLLESRFPEKATFELKDII